MSAARRLRRSILKNQKIAEQHAQAERAAEATKEQIATRSSTRAARTFLFSVFAMPLCIPKGWLK